MDSATKTGIQDIQQRDARTLYIQWLDGSHMLFDVVDLRRRCPCAACVDEITQKPLLDPASVKDDIRPIRIRSVGRYALSIEFTDGHKSGIYAYERLKAMNS